MDGDCDALWILAAYSKPLGALVSVRVRGGAGDQRVAFS